MNAESLRDRTGSGLIDCKKALEACDGNEDLAFYYLKYLGCALVTHGMTNEEWAMMRAKEDYRTGKTDNTDGGE